MLIASGLLMFLFVGYQLWGTGIQEAQSQNRLESSFKNLLAESGVEKPVLGIPSPIREPIFIAQGDGVFLFRCRQSMSQNMLWPELKLLI